jgi:hypothetical protein
VNTKTCPSCGADVPVAATRCKECFHDFASEAPKSMNWLGPLFALGVVALMAVIASVVAAFVFVQPLEQHVLVDDETRSIVWTTKYRTGITTDRMMFDQVASLELASEGGEFVITAVSTTGDRKEVTRSESPLDSQARAYSKIMEKPLVEQDPAKTLLRN